MARILVVDDDALILQALTHVLQAEGHEVVAHSDPLEAACETGFAVVLTDFMMPNLDGVRLLGELRRSNPDAVRILVTAVTDFHVALEAANQGEVYRILSKPWSLPELVSCVRQAVEKHRLVAENRHLAQALATRNDELKLHNQELEAQVVERTNGLLEGLIRALDYRDTETQWHSRRVALYARRIASAAGVTGVELEVIEQGSLLHDLGKIGVRDSILLKPGPLTPEEWVEMRLHPEIGFRMLANLTYLANAAQIVHQHQERWDGRGYPQALAGEQIVLGARIFAVADTLDAITSDRPYRKGRPLAVAKEEIRRCRGSQFDPRMVDAFLAVPDEEWDAIRAQVEHMEAAELERWKGQVLLTPVAQQMAAS